MMQDPNQSGIPQRATALIEQLDREHWIRTDRTFARLMIIQWFCSIGWAWIISPQAWSGPLAEVHIHVWTAIILGGMISSLPIVFAYTRPGTSLTRHVIAAAQALWTAVLIHLTSGRIETHFYVFGSLAFLTLYRDWRVLITASLIVALDHGIRGILWPVSVFGIAIGSPFRWLEHTAWVVFEDVFLIILCMRSVSQHRALCIRQVELETEKEMASNRVEERTEQLQQHGQFLRSIIDSVDASICILDQDGTIIEANAAWFQFTEINGGSSTDFGIGWNYIDLFRHLPDESTRAKEIADNIESVLREKESSYVAEYSCGGDSRRWVQVRVSSLPQEMIGSAVVVHVDITERMNALCEIQQKTEEAERLALVAKGTTNGVILSNKNHEIQWINEGFTRMTGYTLEEVFGKYAPTLASPRSDPESLRRTMEALNRGEGVRTEGILRDKKGIDHWVDFDIQPLHEDNGRIKGYVGISTDISERKQAEEQLRTTLAFQQAILHHAGYGIIAAAPTGVINIFNPAASNMLGYSSEEVIDRLNLIALFDTRELLAKQASRRNGDGGNPKSSCDNMLTQLFPAATEEQEWTWIRKDGSGVPVLLSITPLRGRDQTITALLVIAVDLTERKQIEVQMAQTHRLESIGQLAAGVAHEINTPMQFVSDNVEFLSTCLSTTEKIIDAYEKHLNHAACSWDVRKAEIEKLYQVSGFHRIRGLIGQALADCRDGCERVISIVRAMRQLSHPGTDAFEKAEVNEIVRSASTVCRNHWKYVADLELELESHLPIIDCRIAAISQVLVNLIVNAGDAIADTLGPDHEKDKGLILIQTQNSGNSVTIRVSDSGCGIPEGNLSRIFEPFFTTKPVGKGTGQGLAIAYDTIVNKHKGTLRGESTVGFGTTFIITLPIHQELAEMEMVQMQTTSSTTGFEDYDLIG
jgi:PAS domain S-box-containing protein